MTVQVPVLDKTASKAAKAAARVEEIVGEGFDLKMFVDNFEVLADAAAGPKHLRKLVLRHALTRGFESSCGRWRSGTVGDFVSFLNGYAFKSEWFAPNGVRLLRNANVSHGNLDWTEVAYLRHERVSEFERFALGAGDIVLTLDRPIISTGVKVARVTPSDLPCLLLQRVAKVSATNDVVDAGYLFLWFTSPLFTATIDPGRSNGVPHISTKEVQALPMALPPVAEQKRIVAKVDHLMALCDDLEARQTKKRETGTRLAKSALEALATAEGPDQFDSAWKRVGENFDLIVAGADDVDAARTLLLSLASRGQLLGRPTLKPKIDGALPELPLGWSWKRVDEIADVKLGKMRSPESHSGAHMRPYLRVANVLEGKIDTSDVKMMNFSPDEVPKFELRPHDILLNEGQSIEFVGRPAIYRGEVPGACFQKTLIRVRVREAVDVEFALIVFRAYMRTGRFRQAGVQTTNMAHLPLMRLVGIEFPVPPLAEQKRIVAIVARLMVICDDLEAKLRRAEDRAAKLVEAAVEELVGYQDGSDPAPRA